MAEKIQMTEEQAIQLCKENNDVCLVQKLGCEITCDQPDACLYRTLKKNDYIRKSELQTLVDEAEKMYGKYVHYDKSSETIHKIYTALQALKKEIERLRGKI